MDDDGQAGLASQLAAAANQLLEVGEVDQGLQLLAGLAVDIVASSDHAGVSLLVEDRIHTAAQTSSVAEVVDRIANTTGGACPCLDAVVDEQRLVESGDLSQEERWPAFSTAVVERTAVRSVLAMRLPGEGDPRGTFNLYAESVDAFDDQDRSIASIFAAVVAHAIQLTREKEQLRRALESRDLIGQAKGILMAREGIDDATAFAVLRGASNHMNRKVRDIARVVIEHEQQR